MDNSNNNNSMDNSSLNNYNSKDISQIQPTIPFIFQPSITQN